MLDINNKYSNISSEENSLQNIWQDFCNKFSATQGEAIFSSWVKPLKILAINAGFVELISPSRFVKNWVNANYISIIEKLFSEIICDFKRVDIIVVKQEATTAATIIEKQSHNQNISTTNSITENKTPQLSLPLEKNNIFENFLANKLDAKFTFENFCSFENNILAFNACFNIAINADGFENINPLFVCGKVGLGKTHLLQATAKKAIETNSYKKILYLSAEKFMFCYVRAMKENKLIDFKDYVRASDLLIVDDIQFICGKANFQEELYHTVNSVIDAGGRVILSADRFPHQLDGLEDKIKSRFAGGLIADIKNYNFENRFEILAKKSEIQGQKISDNVLTFVANSVDTSIREAEGAINKIIQIAKLTNKEISLELAKEIVKSTYEKSKKEISLEDIKKNVCKKFGLSFTEIESATRLKKISDARQIAMYLARKHTTKSYPEIGRYFGGKDHATVVHAVKKIEKQILQDENFSGLISSISENF